MSVIGGVVLKSVLGWVGQKVTDLAKLLGAYLVGRAHERAAQEEAAEEDARRARELKDEARHKDRSDLIDGLASKRGELPDDQEQV